MTTDTCQHCRFENPAGFRYCGNCGRPLAAAFPKVPPFVSSPAYHPSQALSSGAYERLKAAADQARGERRNVVVLFADLHGYTALASQMDPEEIFTLINRYLGVMIEQVYKYEGIIDKFTGDGVMALFGAPVAHENDTERAVRATIDMQTALSALNAEVTSEIGVDIQVRLGLHYGAVIFGRVGVDLDEAVSVMDYTAIGDIVNLASRLEQAAEPGTALVSQAVYERTKPLVEYEPVHPLVLKGYSEPVPAYRVVGLRERPGRVRGLEGRRTPLIGREEEMAIVSGAAEEIVPNGTGRILLVTGDGGIGKSRLTAELKEKLRGRDVTVLEGGSLSYRRSVSYWTFREVLSSYFGFQDDDSHTQRQEKIRQRLADLSEELLDSVPLLELMLSIPPADTAAAQRLQQLDAEQLRQQTFVAIRDLFLIEAGRRPLVLILEDLHWADRLSLDLVKSLMDVVSQAPLLLYCISRPLERGSAELLSEHAGTRYPELFTVVSLEPLSPVQCRELLAALLSVPDSPDELHAAVSQHAEGNPFFLEEMIRMLISDGIIHQVGANWELVPGAKLAELDVPDTLQGLVNARFDRLEDDLRQLLQIAAVIGFRFPFRLLRAVTGQIAPDELEASLRILEEQDYIVRQSEEADLTYTFRHAITSETIYRRILRERRTVIHGEVAAAIERIYRNRLAGQVETLATHYARSRYQKRALYYLILSGRKTARSFANTEALNYYQQALDLLDRTDGTLQQRLDVLTGTGDVLTFTGEYGQARRRFQQAARLLPARASEADPVRIGRLKRKISDTFTRQGNYDQALIYLAGALRCLQSGQGRLVGQENAKIRQDIGWVHLRRGNLGQAKTWLQRSLELVDESTQRQLASSIFNRLGGVAFQDGDWEEASGWLGKSLEIQQQLGDLAGMARSHNNLGVMAARQGDLDKARRNLERSLELRSRIGDTEGVLSSYLNLGETLSTLGDLEAAEQALDRALDIAERIGHRFSEGLAQLNLGILWTQAQLWERAIRHLNDSATVFGDIGAQDYLIDVYFRLGEAWLGQGDLDDAQMWGQRSLDLAAQVGSRALSKSYERGRCMRLLGSIAREQENWEEAEKLFRGSVSLFKALGNRLEQGKSFYELALLADARGEKQRATDYLTKSREIFHSLGARLEETRAQERFLASSQGVS